MKFPFFRHATFSVFLILSAAFLFFGCDEGSVNPISTHAEYSSSSKSSSSSQPESSPKAKSSSSSKIFEFESLPNPIRVQDFRMVRDESVSAFTINGTASVNGWDSIQDLGDIEKPYFNEIRFKVTRIGENNEIIETSLDKSLTYDYPEFPCTYIDFSEMGIAIMDTNRTECGNFRLTLTLFATNKSVTKGYDGEKFNYVDIIDFSRETEYCRMNSKSSSSTPETNDSNENSSQSRS